MRFFSGPLGQQRRIAPGWAPSNNQDRGCVWIKGRELRPQPLTARQTKLLSCSVPSPHKPALSYSTLTEQNSIDFQKLCVHASVFTLEGHTSIYGKMADSALVICSTLTMPQTFSREDNCQWSELMFRASAETAEGWWNSSFSPFLSSLTQPGDEHSSLLQHEINHSVRWLTRMCFVAW